MNILSNDLQTKAQNAAADIKTQEAAARWRERVAKRKAKKARRAESAADATRFHNSHTDDLMSAAIVERM